MGRVVSPDLQALIDRPSCITQTTLSLYPVSGEPMHFATQRFVNAGESYTPSLRRTNEILQSILSTPSRVGVEIQNVDKAFGLTMTSEILAKSVAVVGRLYKDADQEKWVELFRGELIPIELTEANAKIEVLHDLVAAGFCVANWTLAENCQFVYKHAGTCGSVSNRLTCNKKRKSIHGCLGDDNEHHFGGMEYPDIQPPSPPTGGGGGGGGDDPGFPTCPRLDQWIRVRGRGYRPVAKQVSELTDRDEIYHPIWKTFHEIDALTIVRSQPIWELAAENRAHGFSSFSHPVLWYREHANGSPVSRFMAGDPVLTWSNGLDDSKAVASADTGETGDVMKIELVDGHIYCYSNTPDGPFIVCHNSKPWDGGYVN